MFLALNIYRALTFMMFWNRILYQNCDSFCSKLCDNSTLDEIKHHLYAHLNTNVDHLILQVGTNDAAKKVFWGTTPKKFYNLSNSKHISKKQHFHNICLFFYVLMKFPYQFELVEILIFPSWKKCRL